ACGLSASTPLAGCAASVTASSSPGCSARWSSWTARHSPTSPSTIPTRLPGSSNWREPTCPRRLSLLEPASLETASRERAETASRERKGPEKYLGPLTLPARLTCQHPTDHG